MKNLYGLKTKFTNTNGEVVEYVQLYLGIKTVLNTFECVPIKVLSKQRHIKYTLNTNLIMFDTFDDMNKYLIANYAD